jgi:DedD protein
VNSHYSSDNDLHDMHREQYEPASNDREISLGTSTVLGIFFALALICAVFFGFGYSMGRRSAQPPAGTAETVTAANSSSSSAKPTPGSLASPATSPVKGDAADNTPDNATADAQPDAPPATQPDIQAAQPEKPAIRPAPIVRVSAPAAAYVAATTPGAATSMVQVAAVSHQEDADVLLSALKKRGYTVAIHQEPQDKLLHVQLGPFPTKKDADTMRQRLLADGYNAIVK